MSDSYDDYESKMQLAEHAWEQALEEKQEPKKQWVGLTDEEINSVRYKRDRTASWTDTTFARAIEAKLKEKNQ